jgi:adenosylhomocysteinase
MGLKKPTIIKDPVSYAKFKVRNFAKPSQLTRTWIEDHSPALLRLRRELTISRPFKGLKIGICLPGTWEAFMYCSVLEAGGGNLFFYPFFCSADVGLELLKLPNVTIFDKHNATSFVRQSDFIHDTAGFLGDIALKQKNCIKGAIEQTASGVMFYEKMDSLKLLNLPVFSLDSSFVKRKCENQMATGLGLIEALLKLHVFLPDKHVLVLGFGSIGIGCASYLSAIGCKVDVYDISFEKCSEAISQGFNSDELDNIISKADIIVNATGSSTPVLDKEKVNKLKNGAILANMGGIGWDRKYLLSRHTQKVGLGITKIFLKEDKSIYEMANGNLVNFSFGSGTDTETMDTVFSLGVMSMQYLVDNYNLAPKHLQPIPDIVQKKHLQYIANVSARQISIH